MKGNGRRQIYLRFGASLAASSGDPGASADGRETKAPAHRNQRTGLRFVGRFGYELHGSKYFARGRGDRSGEPFLCAGAFSPGDGERLFGPRLQGDMDSKKADRRRLYLTGGGSANVWLDIKNE